MAKNTTPDGSKTETPETEVTQPKTLVEKTILGMTEDQMKKSNPEAVQKLQDDAAAKARTESAQALANMKAAFPEDLEFAIEAHGAGMTVDQAKAKRYDDVLAKNKTLAEENASLKKDEDELQVKFATEADKTNGPSGKASFAEMSDDELANQAASVWNKLSQADKAEFGNVKSSFFAYFKKFPEEFETKK